MRLNITMPNCTNTSWTVDNMKAKDIRVALTKGILITHDLGYKKTKRTKRWDTHHPNPSFQLQL